MGDQRVELWAGWSLLLPDGCNSGRNDDGSWSAWDTSHVVDLSIIETSGREDGSALTPGEMIGGGPPGEFHPIDGAIARVFVEAETTDTAEGRQSIDWTRVHVGAVNTVLVMSIANAGVRDAPWHDRIWQSVRHVSSGN